MFFEVYHIGFSLNLELKSKTFQKGMNKLCVFRLLSTLLTYKNYLGQGKGFI